MFSFRMFLSMLAVTLLAVTTESSTGRGRRSPNYDLSGSGLRRLYNSPVYYAEKMERSNSRSGVRVTLEDGSLWLIHKGGKDARTVVTDARHMSSRWETINTRDFEGTKTVADFVSAGNSGLDLFEDKEDDIR